MLPLKAWALTIEMLKMAMRRTIFFMMVCLGFYGNKYKVIINIHSLEIGLEVLNGIWLSEFFSSLINYQS
ncbi:MAG: hypothetical protein ABIO60_00810, partial [Aquaticitalea sp.]